MKMIDTQLREIRGKKGRSGRWQDALVGNGGIQGLMLRTNRKSIRSVVLGLGLFLFMAGPLAGTAQATAFYVGTTDDLITGAANCTTNGNSDCSLREAVAAANADAGASHTINIPANTTITMSIAPDGTPDDNADGDFDFTAATKTITISGADQSTSIIDANSVNRIFDAQAGITLILQNVTLKRGSIAANGGCVLINNTSFTATDVTFDTCAATGATKNGGAVYASTGVSITRATFTGNTATGTGGAIHNASSTGTISDSTFTSNSTSGTNGGALYSAVSSCFTLNGANTFRSNTAANQGGGIHCGTASSTLTINGSGHVFYGNQSTASSGGALYVNGSVTFASTSSATFDSNQAPSSAGGGGAIISQTLTIYNSYFYNNSTGTSGGALYPLSGTSNIYNSTFESNTTTGASLGGGAIYMKNAVYTVNIYNSTFVGNTAPSSAGGAIYTWTNASVNAYNSTFYNNTASTTASSLVAATAGYIKLYNSIVAHPSSATLCSNTARGGTTSINLEYNNSGTACAASSVSSNPGTTPIGTVFSALAYNGGYTKTMALLSGSSAIDAADNATCQATDQRGASRPVNGGVSATCDIGAYEYNGSVPSQSVSGTVYSDEGVTTVAAGKIVRLIKNGTNIAGVTTDSSGNYSITTTLAANDALLVYVDNDATVKGTTVTVSSTTSISGLNIYGGHIITRHNNGGSLTNAHMSTAKGSYSDSDIYYSVSGGALSISGSSTTLYTSASHTFAPGGNVTTVNLKNLGTITGGTETIYVSGTWTNSGTFTANTNTVNLNGTNQTLNGSTTFNNLTKSVASAATLTFQAGQTTTIGGTVTLNGASGQLLTLASSSPGSAWNFTVNSGATKAISYVSVSWSNASTSHASQKPIAPTTSTDGGNNTDWFAASITISGTLYSDEGTTVIATGPTVRLVANGTSIGTAVANGSGVYSITGSVNSGDAILVYIDSNGGTVGTTVSVSNGANLNGLNIYANRVITRHDNSGSLTNALMNTAKGAYVDTDILYSVSGGNLTANAASTELFVWSAHTFAPGGTVTTTHMDVRGTFNPAANAVNVAGNWNVDPAATFTSTGTVTFNATSGTNTITPGGTDANHDFQNVVFNDAAGSATFQLAGAIKATGNFTVTDGIVDTTGSNYAVTVGGNFSQAAGSQMKANASTLTVTGNFSADGSADGATPNTTVSTNYNNASLTFNGTGSLINFTNLDTWYSNGFNNLTVGQGGVTDTLNYWLAVRGMLTVGTGTLTSPATTTLALRSTGNVLSFDAASNLTIDTLMFLNFNAGVSNQNIPTLTNGYGCNISIASSNGNTVTQTGNITLNAGKNLLIKGDGAAARSLSYLTNNFSLTVGGNLILGAGSDTGTKTLNMSNSSVSVAGNFTINSGTNVLTATGSTLTFTGTGIITDSSATKPQQFNSIVVNGTSLTLGSTIKTSTLTVTAGTMNLGASGYTLELTGTGTPLSNSGTFTPGTSTVKYSGTTVATNITTVPYSSLQLTPSAATTYSLTGNLTGANALTGSLTIDTNATLTTTGSNYNITLAGSWNNTGAFTANTSTVTLNGTSQAINGSSTFYNLTKSVTSAATLTIEATKTITIATGGTVTLNGASGQLLTLASSTGSSAWNFVVNSGATKAISYVSVSWSDASGSHSSQKPIAPTNSNNGGNTTDWFAAIVYQSDAMIKLSSEGDGAYLTDNTYEATASVQTKSQGVVSASTATYTLKFQNDAADTDSLIITGTATGSGFTIQYLDDTSTDRTASVTGTGYTISNLAAGAGKVWTLNVTPAGSVAGNTSYNVYVTATSSNDGTKKDQVKATTSSTSAVLTLLKNADKANAAPGEEIAYSVTASNGAGLTAASSVVLTDAVPTNTGFKVASATFSAGTSTLTNAFSYSNDNGSTWTYTPTSTGCSAPANYDYCVTHVKWTTSGTMPSGTNFSIGLVVVVVK